MQFPMSVKWFELLRKRAGEFRMTPQAWIFRQVQNELPGQAIPSLKGRAEAFVVEPSAGLFEGIQAGLADQITPALQEQAEAFRLNPSNRLFDKIQEQLPGQAVPSLAEKAADFRLQPSAQLFQQIQSRLLARRRRRVAALLLSLLMLGSAAWFLPTFMQNQTAKTNIKPAGQNSKAEQTQQHNQGSSVHGPTYQEQSQNVQNVDAESALTAGKTESHAISSQGNNGNAVANQNGSQSGSANPQNKTSAGHTNALAANSKQASGLATQKTSAPETKQPGNAASQQSMTLSSRDRHRNKPAAAANGLAGGPKGKAQPGSGKREPWEPLELKWDKYQAQRIEPLFSWSSFDNRWKRPHLEKVFLRTAQRRPAPFSLRAQFEATALATQMAFSENPDYQGKKSNLLNPASYQDLESRLQTPDFSYQVQAGLEFGFRSVYLRTGLSLLRLTFQQNELQFEHKALIVNVPVTDTLTFTTNNGVDTTVVYSYTKPELKDVLDTTRSTYASRATFVSIPLAFGYRYERGRWFAQADLGVALNLFLEGRGLVYMATGATVLSPTIQADQAFWNSLGMDATARLKAGLKLSRRWSAALHMDLRMGLRPVFSGEQALHQTYSGMGLGFSLNHRLY